MNVWLKTVVDVDVADHILLAISIVAATIFFGMWIQLVRRFSSEIEAWDRGDEREYMNLTYMYIIARAAMEEKFGSKNS